jgi:hypothetical protein
MKLATAKFEGVVRLTDCPQFFFRVRHPLLPE